MKFAVIANKGCHELVNEEVRNITGKKLAMGKSGFYFTTKDAMDGCRLCYLSRSIRRVLLKTPDAGPENKFIRQIGKDFYIDFSGFDLDKRAVKDNPPEFSSSAAYFAAKKAELKSSHVILDPLCRGAKILIEASGILSNSPPGKFFSSFAFMQFGIFKNEDFSKWFSEWDKSRKIKLHIFGMDSYTGNVENAKENLNKAGAEAGISCRSIDWMDALFSKSSVDRIITMMPPGKHESTGALYRELFNQSAYCLKKKGLMVVLSEREELIKKYAEQTGFEIIEKIQLNRLAMYKLKPLA
jgi:23S rRNA G2445 N2-methylase RlmL